MSIWRKLDRMALSAPLKRNGNATVVLDDEYRIIAKGVSHEGPKPPHDAQAIHAERMALKSLPKHLLRDRIVVNWAVDLKTRKICWSSAPCASCVRYLVDQEIGRVVYPRYYPEEKRWGVVDTSPEELLQYVRPTTGKYARDQRVGFLS